MLTNIEKRSIAGQARTLQERLDVPASSGKPVEHPDEWIDEWSDRLADGTTECFDARLERDGLSREECRKRLQTHGWPRDEPVPDWVHRLEELLRFVESAPVEESHPDGDSRPFVHVLAVIVRFAVARLNHAVIPDLLTETAVDGLKDALYARLELFFSHPLFIEFKTFIAHRDESLVLDDNPPRPDDPRQYYDAFVDSLMNGGLKAFFMEYSFLARLVTTHIEQWIDTVEEFCDRLTTDYPTLVDRFGAAPGLGAITAIDARGDYHNGGRQIFCLTFESGQKVAYKPRDMQITAAYYELLTWVNKASELPPFETLAVLSQPEYGWIEWIDPMAALSEGDVEQYYHRAGALICLLYVVGFSDGHLENIIAASDQPVAIDVETLAQPTPIDSNLPINTELRDIIHNSVLQTGLVPMHRPDNDAADNSGFGCSTMHAEVQVRDFYHINTDMMELTYEQETTLEADNLPRLDETVVEGDEYLEELTHGFEQMYEFVQRHADVLVRDDGPLALFAEATVRYVFRPTDNYARVITMMTTPAYLRTGLKFGCKVETLAQPLIADADTDAVWALYESERRALRRGDIPHLSARTDRTALHVGEDDVDDFFAETAVDRIRERLTTLSASDRREQQQYLTVGYHGVPQMDRSPVERTVIDAPSRFVGERADRAACGIIERVMANAKETPTGKLTWMQRKSGPDGGVHVHSLPPDLYAGRLGIALFTAALSMVSEKQQYRALTEEIIDPISDAAAWEDQLVRNGIGGGTGLGAMVYGFTKLGTILNEDHYFEIAHDYRSLLTAAHIAADEYYDVVDGSAGAVLGLLALHDATGDESALDRAITAGDHLLATSDSHNGIPVWQLPAVDCPLTGFAHGTSGIAYALLRLDAATHTDRFRKTALASLAYEQRHYNAETQNWHDLRIEDESYMDAWCHGRSGIGLARLGMAELVGREHIREDLTHALDGMDTSLAAEDHLCCGTCSHIEFLLQAAQTLDEPIYYDQATQLLAASLQRAATRESFTTRWQTEHWYDPAFFQGETGIGYTLLRWLNPSLPCVLLWE